MTKTLITLMLTLTAASASAANWPWQSTAPEQPLPYCKGFVVGGLASKQVSGVSRTELWLAWSYAVRSGQPDQFDATSEYRSGLEQFQNVADASAAASIVANADGECGLGRSGHQITGW